MFRVRQGGVGSRVSNLPKRVGSVARKLVFTVAITVVSRVLIFGARALWRLRGRVDESRPGVVTERHRIPSGDRVLDAVFVRPERPARGTVLLCHGIGETVEHWLEVQNLLAENGVESLVFDYSGYGRSTGWVGAGRFESDAVAAFDFLAGWSRSERIALLGFSMGTGVAAAVAARVGAKRLILCAAFTSLREAARRVPLVGPFAFLLPDLWRTEEELRGCALPVLIVHGEEDRLFRPEMAMRLARACRAPCELVFVPRVSHRTPMYRPSLAFWSVILDCIVE